MQYTVFEYTDGPNGIALRVLGPTPDVPAILKVCEIADAQLPTPMPLATGYVIGPNGAGNFRWRYNSTAHLSRGWGRCEPSRAAAIRELHQFACLDVLEPGQPYRISAPDAVHTARL